MVLCLAVLVSQRGDHVYRWRCDHQKGQGTWNRNGKQSLPRQETSTHTHKATQPGSIEGTHPRRREGGWPGICGGTHSGTFPGILAEVSGCVPSVPRIPPLSSHAVTYLGSRVIIKSRLLNREPFCCYLLTLCRSRVIFSSARRGARGSLGAAAQEATVRVPPTPEPKAGAAATA